MSFVTYFMHLVFVNIPSFFRTDLVLYILPILSVSILLFSLRIMFYQAPKLRRVKWKKLKNQIQHLFKVQFENYMYIWFWTIGYFLKLLKEIERAYGKYYQALYQVASFWKLGVVVESMEFSSKNAFLI